MREMELINVMVNKLISWVDNLFRLFGFYSERYSGLIVWGFIIAIVGKMLKLNFKLSK